jgi:hypothetical protein
MSYPFAGGFGIDVGFLCEGVVKADILNDYDSHIYHFWIPSLTIPITCSG